MTYTFYAQELGSKELAGFIKLIQKLGVANDRFTYQRDALGRLISVNFNTIGTGFTTESKGNCRLYDPMLGVEQLEERLLYSNEICAQRFQRPYGGTDNVLNPVILEKHMDNNYSNMFNII